MSEGKEVGQATERGRSRILAKFRGTGIVLVLIFLLTFVTTPLAVQAAFPGPNGQIAFSCIRDGRVEVCAMNPDGTTQTRLTNASIANGKASWSADGTKIAFQSFRDGDPEIYVMNADGSNQTRLTNVAGADDNPHPSPDGTQIVFDSDRGGQPDIFIMNADGTNQTNLTNNPSVIDNVPAWSLDGTQIAFSSNRDGNFEIFVMNADGTNQTSLTNSPGDNVQPDWSPDGTKIVFESTRDGNQEIYVMNADGTNQTRLTNNLSFDGQPVWSPDGTNIAFMSGRDGNQEIYVMDADGSNQLNITNTSTNESDPNWQPAITLEVDINAGEVYPGDVTTVDLNVVWAQDLYGLQTECAVDPTILDTQSGAFGPFFDTPLVGINSADPGAGTWFGGVSQQSPGAPLTGTGPYATITYQALIPGTTNITCDPLASDINGFELPVVMNNGSLTVLAFGSITGTVT
jgi:Tol biopolymer transport system component